MDSYEATRIVFSRIQNFDPDNASKIMGLLLFQDHGEKEMIRLAFGPEALVHSVIVKARKELGLASNSPPTPSSPSPSPFLSINPASVSRKSSSSSRLSGISVAPLTIADPSSAASATWSSSLSELHNPEDLMSPNNLVVRSSTPSMNSSASPFYANGEIGGMDEFQLQKQLSFLSDGSPQLGPKNPDLFYPQSDLCSSATGLNDSMLFPPYVSPWGGSAHRRSCSVNDACLGSDDLISGLGWKPRLYFARGYCKNGTSCRFLHGGLGDVDASAMVGSPSKMEMMEQCHELLRSKSAQHQRLSAASHLMATSSFPYSPRCMNLLQQHQHSDSPRAAAAAAMMNEDLQKFARSRLERNDFSLNGGSGMVSPASRQIYLTFPADSTFREEDVSNYFSMFGPVQDVRIPFQQKRMFGFVTFVYSETVKLILSKGNPHFVCDARVLVKPYKEKGKIPDKKQQLGERGDYSPCGTPTGLDARDPFDVQLGSRMLYNTQDSLWRRKMEEQADLQQAIDLQSRRLMSLQLLDIKKNHHHRALSTGSGSPIPSPIHSPNLFNQSLGVSSLHSGSDVPAENGLRSAPAICTAASADPKPLQKTNKEDASKEVPIKAESASGNGKNSPTHEANCLQDCFDHILPDSPFASPTKNAADADYLAAFTNGVGDASESGAQSVSTTNKFSSATSPLDMGSFKSFHCQLPRFSSGHGTIGMFAGSGGHIDI